MKATERIMETEPAFEALCQEWCGKLKSLKHMQEEITQAKKTLYVEILNALEKTYGRVPTSVTLEDGKQLTVVRKKKIKYNQGKLMALYGARPYLFEWTLKPRMNILESEPLGIKKSVSAAIDQVTVFDPYIYFT